MPSYTIGCRYKGAERFSWKVPAVPSARRSRLCRYILEQDETRCRNDHIDRTRINSHAFCTWPNTPPYCRGSVVGYFTTEDLSKLVKQGVDSTRSKTGFPETYRISARTTVDCCSVFSATTGSSFPPRLARSTSGREPGRLHVTADPHVGRMYLVVCYRSYQLNCACCHELRMLT